MLGKNKPSMEELYQKFDVNGMIALFKENLKEIQEKPDLIFGPLIKSKYTYLYEKLVKALLNERRVTFTKKKENDKEVNFVTFELYHGKEVTENFDEILENCNFQQLAFNEEDLNKYLYFLKTHSTFKPKTQDRGNWPSEEYFIKLDKEGTCSDLSYPEKLAVNIYTQPHFSAMNKFLRGKIEANANLSELSLHCAIVASALQRVPNEPMGSNVPTLRAEGIWDERVHKERIKAAKKGEGIFTQPSFYSTSTKALSQSFFQGEVRIVIQNPIGKYIAPLSYSSDENEWLIPPTQLNYKGVYEENGRTYFLVEPARTLTGLTAKQQAYLSDSESLEELKEFTNYILNLTINIKADFEKQPKKSFTYKKREKQICDIILKANNLLQDPHLSPQQKLFEIENTLKRYHTSIKTERRPFFGLFSSKSRLQTSIEKIEKKIYYDSSVKTRIRAPENVLTLVQSRATINHVFSEFLSKPYTDKSYLDHWAIKNPRGNIERPNHGLAHTLRCVSYAPSVLEMYKNNFKNEQGREAFKNISKDKLQKTQIALLFVDAGRQNDIDYESNPKLFDKFRKHSASAFENYVKKHMKGKFSSKELSFYKNAIIHFSKASETDSIMTIMRTCHQIDLLRRYSPKEFNLKIHKTLSREIGHENADRLEDFAAKTILATGDSLRGQSVHKGYNINLFRSCSHYPDKCLDAISSVERPVWIRPSLSA